MSEEENMEVGDGSRICRENGADERGKSQSSRRSAVVRAASFKKVQVVYYLSRNGQLEHPHYMEVTHLAHQHLRLKGINNLPPLQFYCVVLN